MSAQSEACCANVGNLMPCRGVDCAVEFNQARNAHYIKMFHIGFNTRANNGAGYKTRESALRAVAKIKAESDRRRGL